MSLWERLSNDEDPWNSFDCADEFVDTLTNQIEEAEEPRSTTSHLVPIINGLLGFLFEALGDDDEV